MLVLLAALVAFAVASVLRLSYWQVARGSELRTEAYAQLEQRRVLPAVRGDILDRNGAILATTVYRDRLAAYPDMINDADRRSVADDLAEVLGLDDAGRDQILAVLDEPGSQYAVLDRQLTEEQSRRVREELAADRLWGLTLESYAVRVYPNAGGAPGTSLASQLLGFVNSSGVGHYGIEQEYDKYLAGMPKVLAAASANGRVVESSARVLEPGVDGTDVQLTIDASLQLQLEKELFAAWVADKAKRVSALIMDPDTGAILAWASVPGYDANHYSQAAASSPELFQDPIASLTYEPGSVMKMLTATAALKNDVVRLNQRVPDKYAIRFGTQLIRNADWKSMGRIRFKDAISYSRNVATATVAGKLGTSTRRASSVLYRTWRDLGIGRLTGIDIANEAAGIAVDPKRQPWAPIDLANRSFGQAVAVTPIQLATAYTPMINGGMHVQPHFLAGVGGQAHESAAPTRAMSRKLAGQLRKILDHTTSAVPWYAEGSLIPGYQVGGKTGTAQIWLADKGRYAAKLFNFSFIGYVGGDNPEAVVAIRIQEAVPKIEGRGDLKLGITSYELFRRVARDTISTLEIRQSSNPRAGLPERGSAAERWFNQLQADAQVADQERQERERERAQARADERPNQSAARRDARGERASGANPDPERTSKRRTAAETDRETPRRERGGG
jgi:cell division protein FtsI (penicillin-binding protein 3)